MVDLRPLSKRCNWSKFRKPIRLGLGQHHAVLRRLATIFRNHFCFRSDVVASLAQHEPPPKNVVLRSNLLACCWLGGTYLEPKVQHPLLRRDRATDNVAHIAARRTSIPVGITSAIHSCTKGFSHPRYERLAHLLPQQFSQIRA